MAGRKLSGLESTERVVLGRALIDNRIDHHKINPIPHLMGTCDRGALAPSERPLASISIVLQPEPVSAT